MWLRRETVSQSVFRCRTGRDGNSTGTHSFRRPNHCSCVTFGSKLAPVSLFLDSTAFSWRNRWKANRLFSNAEPKLKNSAIKLRPEYFVSCTIKQISNLFHRMLLFQTKMAAKWQLYKTHLSYTTKNIKPSSEVYFSTWVIFYNNGSWSFWPCDPLKQRYVDLWSLVINNLNELFIFPLMVNDVSGVQNYNYSVNLKKKHFMLMYFPGWEPLLYNDAFIFSSRRVRWTKRCVASICRLVCFKEYSFENLLYYAADTIFLQIRLLKCG